MIVIIQILRLGQETGETEGAEITVKVKIHFIPTNTNEKDCYCLQ